MKATFELWLCCDIFFGVPKQFNSFARMASLPASVDTYFTSKSITYYSHIQRNLAYLNSCTVIPIRYGRCTKESYCQWTLTSSFQIQITIEYPSHDWSWHWHIKARSLLTAIRPFTIALHSHRNINSYTWAISAKRQAQLLGHPPH